MRFDLEFNVTSELTQDGLDLLSETLYGSSEIEPAFWDTNSLTTQSGLNVGSVDLSSYNKKKNIPEEFISSGVDLKTSDLAMVSNITNKDFTTPSFNGGFYSSNKSKFIWSKNAIVKQFEFVNGYYECEIDADIDPTGIIVSTLCFNNKEFYSTKKDFVFVSFDTDLATTFKKSTMDYKFTVNNNKVFLNIEKILYTSTILENVDSMYLLPEFPANNLTTNITGNYKYQHGVIVFRNMPTEEVYVSFEVSPIISYIKEQRTNDDVIFNNLNMHPRLLNYKNGTLCVRPNFNTLDIPKAVKITSNKDVVFGAESAKINVELVGAGDISLASKEISLKILSNNAIFTESSSLDNSTITLKTYINGEVSTELVPYTDKLGYYIQPEWVNFEEKKITIPFKIDNIKAESTYIYFVTADDPFLGKKNIIGDEVEFREYYTSNKLSSYEMNGRKIAYVKLKDDNGILRSKFVKPLSCNSFVNDTGIQTSFKNLKYNDIDLIADAIGGINIGSEWIFSPEFVTEITYPDIPYSNNIVGFWLITDSVIEVQASYSDANASITSEILSINLQNISSENAFTLNKYSSTTKETQYGTFGYYTISEYLKNPFGLNAFSFYCMHSDCVFKRCIHPDLSLHDKFILDEGRIGCARTKDYESNNDVGFCSGLDAHLINPFIMETSIG